MINEIKRHLFRKKIIDSILKNDAPPLGLSHKGLRVILYKIIGGADSIAGKLAALSASKRAGDEDRSSLSSINEGLDIVVKKLKEMDLNDSLHKLATSGQITLKNIVRNLSHYSDFLKYMSNQNEYDTDLDRSSLRKASGDTQALMQFVKTLIFK